METLSIIGGIIISVLLGMFLRVVIKRIIRMVRKPKKGDERYLS